MGNHEKMFGICENKCLVETVSKVEFDEFKNEFEPIDTTTLVKISTANLKIGDTIRVEVENGFWISELITINTFDITDSLKFDKIGIKNFQFNLAEGNTGANTIYEFTVGNRIDEDGKQHTGSFEFMRQNLPSPRDSNYRIGLSYRLGFNGLGYANDYTFFLLVDILGGSYNNINNSYMALPTMGYTDRDLTLDKTSAVELTSSTNVEYRNVKTLSINDIIKRAWIKRA